MTKLNSMSTKPDMRFVLKLTGLLVTLQILFNIGSLGGLQLSVYNALNLIEQRVSLDISAVDVGNQTLNTAINVRAVERYVDELNQYIDGQAFPLRVESIQGVASNIAIPTSYQRRIEFHLETSEQRVTVVTRSPDLIGAITFSGAALFLSLVAGLALYLKVPEAKAEGEITPENEEPVATPKLVIDLQNKTLGNGIGPATTPLQNKPLCFYTALIKYCIEHPNASLVHHQDVPNELITLANKVFSRLIELGHTKRKRPDFNANLDKTLSEIRAVLDEVFADYPYEKERFYPPRAQGEGSRSKQHSYALPALHNSDIEIIGA